ncbi:hypothetical protein A5656_02410 [Mycobacterium gordonae]|nr:hypothetical protein A5656_02410 [Mycobacterium gordonae]
MPDDTELVQSECVGQVADVGRPIAKSASRLEGRTPESRAVDRNQPEAVASCGTVDEYALEPGARRAVEVERGIAGCVAPLQVGELAAVGQKMNMRLVGADALGQHTDDVIQRRSIARDMLEDSRNA